MSVKIEELRLYQFVYYYGELNQITSINVNGAVGLVRENNLVIMVNYSDLFLTPTKEKKRYWQWKFKDSNGCWYRGSFYMDDYGKLTNGRTDFGSYEKQKIEDDFIEV